MRGHWRTPLESDSLGRHHRVRVGHADGERDRVEVGPVDLAVDKTRAQTESQLRMTGYLDTDERQDVLASLEHCALCLVSAESSSGAWKWVVLSLHSALQGAMICHLSGTAGVGALTSTCARQWSQWHERDGRGEIDYIDEGVDELGLPARRLRNPDERPPSDRVANAPELFKRLGSESERIESGCGRIIAITAAQKQSFKRLHDLSNGFTHFSPRGWSIELQLIEDVVPDILDVIAQIADDGWPFRHMSAEEHQLLRDTVSDLRRRFSAPSGIRSRA